MNTQYRLLWEEGGKVREKCFTTREELEAFSKHLTEIGARPWILDDVPTHERTIRIPEIVLAICICLFIGLVCLSRFGPTDFTEYAESAYSAVRGKSNKITYGERLERARLREESLPGLRAQQA